MISTKAPKAAAFAAALLLAGAAIAAPMVIRASGPSAVNYRSGQRLATDQAVVLKAGDQLVVLDAQGTRSLQGPGSFRFDQAATRDTGAVVAFAGLLTQNIERRARIGAVRGVAPTLPSAPKPPGIWAIDSGASGTVCILNPIKAALWRADPLAAGSLTVTRDGESKSSSVEFGAGQSIADWTAASPGSYRLSGGAKPVTVTVKTISPAPASIGDLGAALAENHCAAQLDRLASLTATAEVEH